MNRRYGALLATLSAALFAFVPPPAAAQAASADARVDAAKLYAQHCASCHGAQRTGAMGPALLPESLERLRRPDAAKVVAQGRTATQMPAFGDQLGADEVAAVVDWIYRPASPPPAWTDADIRASRSETPGADTWPARPQWSADPMNLFVVVEGGDHHVSLVDGDRFERIHRFESRYALHGGPKFTPDGRYVFFGSRDGWITKYDLWNLKVVAEVRAGLNMRNVAVSGDGRWVMAANYLPRTVVLFDAALNLVRTYAATTLDGKASSRVSAVYDATPRRSFVVALKDIPELWEISYDPKAEPIHDGLVHDYKMGEAIAKPGYLGVRRTPLDEPLDDFFFDQSYRHALGATRPKGDGRASAQVVNLDIRRKIADLPIAGMPHLGSGITFAWNGTTVLASPNLKDGAIDVIDMKTWKTVKTIATPGYLGVRRTPLDEPLDDFFFDQSYRHALGATRPKGDGRASAQVVNLDIRRKIADLPIAGMPHLGSGITFAWNGTTVLASPNLKDGAIDVIDMKTWKTVKTIATPGPGFFMRSHEKTPYAWTDSMMSPSGRDTLTIIDKRTLEPVASVREPGRTLAHIEFTKDGRYALASLWENDGALIVYDAATFREVKRLPMSKPVGKYNVWNKITRSEGTSH